MLIRENSATGAPPLPFTDVDVAPRLAASHARGDGTWFFTNAIRVLGADKEAAHG